MSDENMKGLEEKLANVGAKAVNYMTSFNEVESMAQFTAFGLHQCPTCGKITQWQGQPPGKCWCESLIERVVALEAWKAEMLNHAISAMMTPPSKAERGQLGEYYLPKGIGLLPTTDSQPIGYDQRPKLPRGKNGLPLGMDDGEPLTATGIVMELNNALKSISQPEIDWEKVGEAAVAVSKIKWSALPSSLKEQIVKDVRAAVAEYLRQVKEGGK